MANQYKNKVVYNGATLIDLSDTTAVQSDVASGKYFYLATGEKVEGTASGGDEPVTPTETLLGNTPYTLLEDANIKLVGDGSYTYSYTGTIADFEDRQNVTGTGAILTDEGSYYQLVDNGASAWYQALIQMSFDGLTVGSSYTITVNGTGDGTTSTSGYWVIRDANGDNTYGTINPLAGTSSLTFEATTTSINVMLGCADSTSWDNGIRTAKFTDMVITGAVEGSGSGEVALGQLTAGTQITSSPSVEVYAIIESSGTLRGKTCVCLGDSVTALMAPPNDYPSVLASNTGMTVINGGFEGCRMTDTHPTATYAAFSAVKLADAIATGSWTTQDANISGFDSGSYAPSHLTALKAVNWSNVDYITVEFGGNDAGDQYVYINNASNPTDTTTYVGAAKYVYNRIHTAYPNIKIMFFVPMYRYWISEGKDSDEMTFTLGGNTYHYYDWGDALIASPPASGVPVIDMYRTLGINASNRTTYLLTSDQTHPSVAGCELIAQKFQTELTNHFLPSGGGSSATLITKTITENGTYSAEDDNADGYSEVVVNVSSGGSETTYETIVPLQTINCTIGLSNGAYGGYISNYTEYPIEGQKYRVIFDGTEYTPLTAAYYGSGTTYLYVGDANVEASSTVTPTYPFEVMLYDGQTFYLGVKGSGSHTLQVDKITSEGGGGGGSATLITKTITENGTYNASSDSADGYSSVTVNVPTPAAVAMNVQTVQSTDRRNNTALGSVTSLTCSTAGTYDVYWTCARSSTSGTWGSQLYINGTAYGTENATFSNHIQNNHLTGVTIPANATVAIYGRSRSGYYIYVPQLTIVQTA